MTATELALGRRVRPVRRVALAIAAAACTAAVALAVHAGGGSAAGTSTTSGLPRTSQFSLPPVTGGAPVTLAAASGRPVLLSFFASWCDSCQQELRTMAGVVRAGAGRVAVIGVDVNDTDAAAAALLRADHLAVPVGADHGGGVAAAYGLIGLPTTVVLDAGHRVVGEVVGPLTPGAATSWLSRLAR